MEEATTATQTVAILGAGWAGLPLAHKLLKYTAPRVAQEKGGGLRVVLVSPNSHFFWNVAAARGVIPGEISDDELFLPIEPAFAQYPRDQFEFVLGAAEGIDAEGSKVKVVLNDGAEKELAYDHLVIATGSRVKSGLPLKPVGTHEGTLARWKELQERVGAARSIVVAGGGPTGVELAGELAARYGDEKEEEKRKTITIVMSGDKPVSTAMPSVQDVILRDLHKLGVNVVRGARVESVRETSSASPTMTTSIITLSDGQTFETDLYLPAHGVQVNTSFVPKKFLDPEGSVRLDPSMRVTGTSNVWAIGDVGNLEPKQLTVTDSQIIHLSSALHAALTMTTMTTGPGAAVSAYRPAGKTMVFVSLGRRHAAGQVGGWRLWGWVVSYVKGRRLFVDTAQGYVGGKHLRHAAM
ncbi:hypothetical protein N3K66_000261 [Trichothecium roseum]|uniref:Uncharacterized protein n=1 Tax=Trichothecium roseum TaxID=47278 RepID=A0ACC0VBB8_9HYPO|nr:hypothetical protein N3K66_000261 [Trichothecium roseum]